MTPRLVLIVDDSAAVRRQLCTTIRGLPGLQAVEAADGADAWRKLCSGTFDLVVTDVNMPVLDGLKLISLVRGGGAHRRVPVIVVTTEGAEADRRRALGLGADDYLVKPVQAEQVLDSVRRLLWIAG